MTAGPGGAGVNRLEALGTVTYIRRTALAALVVCLEALVRGGADIRRHATDVIQLVRAQVQMEPAASMYVLHTMVTTLFAHESKPRDAEHSRGGGEGEGAGGRGGSRPSGESVIGSGRTRAPFVDSLFDVTKVVVGEALRVARWLPCVSCDHVGCLVA